MPQLDLAKAIEKVRTPSPNTAAQDPARTRRFAIAIDPKGGAGSFVCIGVA